MAQTKQQDATEPAADAAGAKESAGAVIDRFGGLIVGGLSLAGLILIAWVLWPASLGGASSVPEQSWEVDGLMGTPTPAPGGGWYRGRDAVRAGDVLARRDGEEVTFRYLDGGGRRSSGPSLVGPADQERVEVLLRLRRNAGLRERLGVSMDQLRPAIEAGRGTDLDVPEAQRRAVLEAMKAGDRDAAEAAVAAAGNAARGDFLARTQAALDALREAVSDDLVDKVRGGDATARPDAADDNAGGDGPDRPNN